MTSSRLLISMLIVMLIILAIVSGDTRSIVDNDESSKTEHNTTLEVLDAHANRIDLHNREVREWDLGRYWLWGTYNMSSGSHMRPTIIMDINKEFTQWEYLNSRIDMVGLILFGPENGRSIIRSVRGPKQNLVDELQCLESTAQLFYKHCHCIHEHCLRRFPSFANMCNHASDKAAIKEAIIVACVNNKIEPYVVNVKNSSISRFTPAPVRGSMEYRERASVEGISRMKLGSFPKKYRVLICWIHQTGSGVTERPIFVFTGGNMCRSGYESKQAQLSF
ncbi:hypothetical protein CTI12_AA483920 [Artemisia annua]|uniref:Legumain prodomain domain-containing protein n=1 Tax=Artemisia annua TaxID=35608 RepID=A0A2U1LJK4_ARTAN|nr:hypothetical protein CTI12_AA483920 [Artemisia annua]